MTAIPSRVRQLVDGVWQYVTFDEGGGGGSQAVLKSTPATLTDAQIKALPGTEVELIAAPGAGKMIVPLAAYLINDFAVAYTGIDADTEYPALWIANVNNDIYLVEFIDEPDTPQTSLTTFLTSTNEFGKGSWALYPRQGGKLVGGTGPFIEPIASGGVGVDTGENAALKIGADNSINFTGGDAANTLSVTVLYTVLAV